MSRQDDYRFLSAAVHLSTFSIAELARYSAAPLDTAKTWFRRERQRAEKAHCPCRFEPVTVAEDGTAPRRGPRARRWKLTEAAAADVVQELRRLYAEAAHERSGDDTRRGVNAPALPDLDAAEALIAEAHALPLNEGQEALGVRICTRLQLALDEARDLDEAGIAIPADLAQRLGKAYVRGGLIPCPDQRQSLDRWRIWIADGLGRFAKASVPPRLAAPILHGIFLSGRPAEQHVQRLWFPLAALSAFGVSMSSPASSTHQQIIPFAHTLVEYIYENWRLLDILYHLLKQTPTQREIDPIVHGLPLHPLLKSDPASGLWLLGLAVTEHWRPAYEQIARGLLLQAPGCNHFFLDAILHEASLRINVNSRSDADVGQLIEVFQGRPRVLYDSE